MEISKRDAVQILSDENELLKLENQQITDKLSHQQQAFRVLHEIDTMLIELSSNEHVDTFINRVLELVLVACNSENGSLLLIDEETNELVFAEVIGESSQDIKGQRMNINTGIVGKSIKSRRAELVRDVKQSPSWSSAVDDAVGFSTKSLMCAPLLDGDRVMGALEVVNIETDAVFNEADLCILSVITRYVSLIILKTEAIALGSIK